MSIIRIFNNVFEKRETRKIIEIVTKATKQAEIHKTELYELNNNIKGKLLGCLNINDVLKVKIEDYLIPHCYTEKIDKKLLGYSNKFDELIENEIDKFNKVVFCINEYITGIQQYRDVISDIKFFIKEKKISSFADVFVKLGFDKKNNLLCMVCDFSSLKFNNFQPAFIVYVVWGNYKYEFGEREYLYMNLYLKENPEYKNLHLSTIEIIKGEKRLGVGTFALKGLEDTIIPELNKRIEKYIIENEDEDWISTVKVIEGQIGELDSSMSNEDRSKFYSQNGYLVIGDLNFYKDII